MLGLLVQNQSHRTGTHLRGKLLRRIAHQTFFSGEMVSANPGAVQIDLSGEYAKDKCLTMCSNYRIPQLPLAERRVSVIKIELSFTMATTHPQCAARVTS